MWLARDKDDTLCLYPTKPVYDEEFECWQAADDADLIFNTNSYSEGWVEINADLYPEVTFENSPIQLKLVL